MDRIENATDFWNEMVIPDYQESINQFSNLRLAFHCAISLNHMADWIFYTYVSYVRANFTYVNTAGATVNVSSAKTFANALEQIEPNFALIRGIANAAKHLQLSNVRPHPSAPSNAANTSARGSGWGQQGFGTGPWGGAPRVMLAGPNGNDTDFKNIADSVFGMWEKLKTKHGW